MTELIKFMTASYKNIEISSRDARRLRGFFANLDQTDSNLHNHTPEGEQMYRYPLVQYKVLNGHPFIVAWGEGIRSIYRHLMEQKQLVIGEKTFTDMELDIVLSEKPVGDSLAMRSYRFMTPWLALNKVNYKCYHDAKTQEERDEVLNRVLTGNILSICKGFGVTIEGQIKISHELKEIAVSYKGEHMTGFLGTFHANCCLPSFCGIGKGTARGFGTIHIDKMNQKEDACEEN